MSIKLTDKSIIYIASPANFVTGGPEALHQLLYKLKSLGFNAHMYYVPNNLDNPVPERFAEYNISFKRTIEDNAVNVLIVPEVSTEILSSYKYITKAIWWLSIDNYFASIAAEGKLNKLKRVVTGTHAFRFTDKNANTIYHLAQSHYAFDFLKRKQLNNVFLLSDYLNKSYFEDASPQPKVDQVLYNPKKGFEHTSILIKQSPEIKWVALENMALDQVKAALKMSKVYIDFGQHPGKDRIPREAAINGCCVITGLEGSAKFQEDVSIPEEFKFENVQSEKEDIISLIKKCFQDYEEMANQFKPYRNRILGEELRFEEEIKNIFAK